jgi:multicomponent Na+:H+ antiporter subunit F
MNTWLWADVALLLSIVPCALVILRSETPGDWLVGLQMAGLIVVLALLILAQAMKRPSFFDLAVALALLSFSSGLLFAHFITRWFR